MTQPRITVITPSLNQGRYLERTICSVLDQGYANLQYIVVDGGSTDDSLEIIRQYETALSGWISEPDAGPAEAINKGLARTTGEIVAFLAADDLYLPGALDAVAKAMTGPDRASWVVGHAWRIGERDQMLDRLTAAAPSSLAAFLMHDSGLLPACSAFFDAALVQRHGLLDPGMKFAYDYEFNCRLLAESETPTILPAAVSARRTHDESRSALNTVQQGLEFISAARQYADRLPVGQRYDLWRNCDSRERIYALAQAEMQGREARRFLWQRVLVRPWWLTNDALRHALVHGIEHPVPPEMLRPAA